MVERFAVAGGKAWPPLGSPTQLYGGSLDGIRERLDYIAGLGVNLLWLSPVMMSPSHHGYDQADHFAVEPRYGGNGALTPLVQAAHEPGLRVLPDFPPNHTRRTHPLLPQALRTEPHAAH